MSWKFLCLDDRIGEFLQLPDLLWKSLRQVVLFSDVGIQIVEFHDFFAGFISRIRQRAVFCLQEFPLSLSHTCAPINEVIPALPGPAQQQIGLVNAVDDTVGRYLEAGQAGKGRKEIDRCHDGVRTLCLPGPFPASG